MKKRILFVCWGNICRSPSAETVFRELVRIQGHSQSISCDSAGTISYHNGEKADARMRQHAQKRGYNITSISRKFDPSVDFDAFDMIIAMDDNNFDDLLRMTRTENEKGKLYKMTDFSSSSMYDSVPDPYYGGENGFELVLDILEDACAGLLKHIVK